MLIQLYVIALASTITVVTGMPVLPEIQDFRKHQKLSTLTKINDMLLLILLCSFFLTLIQEFPARCPTKPKKEIRGKSPSLHFIALSEAWHAFIKSSFSIILSITRN